MVVESRERQDWIAGREGRRTGGGGRRDGGGGVEGCWEVWGKMRLGGGEQGMEGRKTVGGKCMEGRVKGHGGQIH
jgi:hypothetical protein